jgi:hypothetical protein
MDVNLIPCLGKAGYRVKERSPGLGSPGAGIYNEQKCFHRDLPKGRHGIESGPYYTSKYNRFQPKKVT